MNNDVCDVQHRERQRVLSASHIQLVLQLCGDVQVLQPHDGERFCKQLDGALYDALQLQLVHEQGVSNNVQALFHAILLRGEPEPYVSLFCKQDGGIHGVCDHGSS